MQIVIDIPREKYELCKRWKPSERNQLQEIIASGTPLPKGHGRLVDADVALRSEQPSNCSDELWAETTLARCINTAPTIIEADGGNTE